MASLMAFVPLVRLISKSVSLAVAHGWSGYNVDDEVMRTGTRGAGQSKDLVPGACAVLAKYGNGNWCLRCLASTGWLAASREQVAGAPRVVARDWELWLSFMNRWADGLHEAGLTLTADIQVRQNHGMAAAQLLLDADFDDATRSATATWL
jgi:hypothetical protein